jgi:hypothetical protein
LGSIHKVYFKIYTGYKKSFGKNEEKRQKYLKIKVIQSGNVLAGRCMLWLWGGEGVGRRILKTAGRRLQHNSQHYRLNDTGQGRGWRDQAKIWTLKDHSHQITSALKCYGSIGL